MSLRLTYCNNPKQLNVCNSSHSKPRISFLAVVIFSFLRLCPKYLAPSSNGQCFGNFSILNPLIHKNIDNSGDIIYGLDNGGDLNLLNRQQFILFRSHPKTPLSLITKYLFLGLYTYF